MEWTNDCTKLAQPHRADCRPQTASNEDDCLFEIFPHMPKFRRPQQVSRRQDLSHCLRRRPSGLYQSIYHIKGVHLPGGVCHISRAKQSSISSTHTRVNKRPPSSYEPTGQTPRRSKPVRSPQKSHDHHTTILTLAPALSSSRTSPTTSRPRNSSSYSANSALCARSARALRTTQKAQPLSSTRM